MGFVGLVARVIQFNVVEVVLLCKKTHDAMDRLSVRVYERTFPGPLSSEGPRPNRYGGVILGVGFEVIIVLVCFVQSGVLEIGDLQLDTG